MFYTAGFFIIIFFISTFVELNIYSTFVEQTRIMTPLSKAEEEVMQILWKKEKAIMMDILEAYPEPKPANTTIATLLKRIQDKGFVSYTQVGRSREYFPLVKKNAYFSKQMNGMIKKFFNNSASQFASFFTEEANMSKEELEDLKKLIDNQIKNKD